MKSTENNSVLKIPPHYRGVLLRMGVDRNRFVCYAHRLLSDASFDSEIIDRYPRTERPELPFPAAIKMVQFALF